MKDPDFAKEYNETYEQITAVDHMVRTMIERSGKKFIVLASFRVAHPGWECDSDGCIVQDESDNRHVILTNHGSPYFATREELVSQVDKYYKLIANTNDAIAVLDHGRK